MKIIAAWLLLFVASTLVFLIRTGSKTQFLAFYFLGMLFPFSMYFGKIYFQAYTSLSGMIIFLLTIIGTLVLWAINRKKRNDEIIAVQQLLSAFNYPLLIFEIAVQTVLIIKKLWKLMHTES